MFVYRLIYVVSVGRNNCGVCLNVLVSVSVMVVLIVVLRIWY